MKHFLLASLFLLAACSSGLTESNELLTAACWPPSVDTYDGGIGCQPNRTFNICTEYSSTSESCSDYCAASDYSLTCRSAETVVTVDGGTDVTFIDVGPDTSLGCQIVPIPTPVGTRVYCCPCGG
jgi:hypothetical protein